jgi:hypothetical protein
VRQIPGVRLSTGGKGVNRFLEWMGRDGKLPPIQTSTNARKIMKQLLISITLLSVAAVDLTAAAV